MRAIYLFSIFVFLTVGFTNISFAANQSRGVKHISFNGEVTERSVADLLERVRRAREQGYDPIVVILSSEGGDVRAALAAADELRSLGVDTEVYGGDNCDSSCTILFAAGRRRIAPDGSHFLFHPVEARGHYNNKDGTQTPFTDDENRAQRDRYAQDWSNAVRTDSPRLADELDRNRTLRDTQETYYNDGTDEREPGRQMSGQELRDDGYATDSSESDRTSRGGDRGGSRSGH